MLSIQDLREIVSFFVIAPSSRKDVVFMLNIITTEVPIEDELKESIETNKNDYSLQSFIQELIY